MASKVWVKGHWYQISKRQLLYQEDGGTTDQLERDIKALLEAFMVDGLSDDPKVLVDLLPRGIAQEKIPKEIIKYYEQCN